MPPGGHWFGRLKDEYVFNPDLKCFTAVGKATWNELHGSSMNKMVTYHPKETRTGSH